MNDVYLITGMVLVTFSVRYFLFVAAGQFEFPEIVSRALRFVPPAVLSAIIFPAILAPTNNELNLHFNNPYLFGGFIAAIVAWKSKNLLITIVIGMCGFLIWKWVLGV